MKGSLIFGLCKTNVWISRGGILPGFQRGRGGGVQGLGGGGLGGRWGGEAGGVRGEGGWWEVPPLV